MRTSLAIRAGLAFGAAVVVGGTIAAAVDTTGSTEPSPVFSTEQLTVLSNNSAVVDDPEATLSLDEGMTDYLDGASVYRASQAAGITAYVAELADGSLCVIGTQAGDGTTMTCGTPEMAAVGQVTYRSQNRPDDLSYFVGIASNDVTGIAVDSKAGHVASNVFIAVGSPTTDAFIIEGADGTSVTVDMNVDQEPDNEVPAED